MSPFDRRTVILGLASLGLAAATARVHADGGNVPPSELRIGYQKSGPLVILRQQKGLERRFGSAVAVRWSEFQSGPPLLEALNAGGIDFGTTGDTPPIFAQAAGADLVYVGYQPAIGRNAAILVRKDAPIRSLADLKGKRIAFTKGSSAHNHVVRALEAGGLRYDEVTPIYLQPADAAAAFRNGGVDAWAIWDPYFAVAERDPETRVLATAENVAPSNSFFLAHRDFARHHPAAVTALIEEINLASKWSETHQQELAATMAQITGVDIAAQRVAAARGTYGVDFLTEEVIRQQQAIADTFQKLGLIPRRIAIADAVWTPPAS